MLNGASFQEKIGLAMEEYFGNGLMIREIEKKLGISYCTITRNIEKMICLKESENTIVITKQSKINS